MSKFAELSVQTIDIVYRFRNYLIIKIRGVFQLLNNRPMSALRQDCRWGRIWQIFQDRTCKSGKMI